MTTRSGLGGAILSALAFIGPAVGAGCGSSVDPPAQGSAPERVVRGSLAASSNRCANVSSSNNGLYCGLSHQAGFIGFRDDYYELFDCENGTVNSVRQCTYGCIVALPGVADFCKSGPDPCSDVPSWADGVYCGLSRENNFADYFSHEAFELITCQNQVTVAVSPCGPGCVVARSGTADYCAPVSACTAPPNLVATYTALGSGNTVGDGCFSASAEAPNLCASFLDVCSYGQCYCSRNRLRWTYDCSMDVTCFLPD